MSRRAEALADRILQGAEALAAYAETLTDAEWRLTVPKDGRAIGVIVHHVGSVYPVEIQLAMALAGGNAVAGVTWDAVAQMNADHARDHAGVGKDETVRLVRESSKAAAAAVRSLTDEQLDRAAPVSLNSDAPLTCQFLVEDHALRHSFHHLAKIRATVEAARAGR